MAYAKLLNTVELVRHDCKGEGVAETFDKLLLFPEVPVARSQSHKNASNSYLKSIVGVNVNWIPSKDITTIPSFEP